MHSRQSELKKQREDLLKQIAAEKRAPRADWQNTTFAWDTELQEELTGTFGLQSFRWEISAAQAGHIGRAVDT